LIRYNVFYIILGVHISHLILKFIRNI